MQNCETSKYKRLENYISLLEDLFEEKTEIFNSDVHSILLGCMGNVLAAFENGVPVEEYFQTFLEEV